jgi:plasmid stabilization system protein ParE
MRSFKLAIDPEALTDIQEATDWYNKQLSGLGTRFQRQVKNQINALKRNASIYSTRYDEVRCVLVRKFPYLIHYMIDRQKNQIAVFAVFHTSRNPKIWLKRKGAKS